MQEEFGVTVSVGRKITSGSFTHRDKPCTLDVLEVHFPHDGIAEPFVLTEHTEYKWENINDIPSLNFVDSDLSVYDAVKRWCENESK
jgi:8-oxo-dGTP diphosphatase